MITAFILFCCAAGALVLLYCMGSVNEEPSDISWPQDLSAYHTSPWDEA